MCACSIHGPDFFIFGLRVDRSVLILGSGMVVGPALDVIFDSGANVTLASNDLPAAEQLAAPHLPAALDRNQDLKCVVSPSPNVSVLKENWASAATLMFFLMCVPGQYRLLGYVERRRPPADGPRP